MKLLDFLAGVMIGSKSGRKFIVKSICEASLLVDKQLKKTPIAEFFKDDEKENEKCPITKE